MADRDDIGYGSDVEHGVEVEHGNNVEHSHSTSTVSQRSQTPDLDSTWWQPGDYSGLSLADREELERIDAEIRRAMVAEEDEEGVADYSNLTPTEREMLRTSDVNASIALAGLPRISESTAIYQPSSDDYLRMEQPMNTARFSLDTDDTGPVSFSDEYPTSPSRNGDHTLQPAFFTLEEFHYFRKLPKELQLKIWRLLIPGARIIDLKTITVNKKVDQWGSELRYKRCVAQNDHPVLLHICADTRALAQETYQLSFEDELKYPVYMDHERDVLLFQDTQALDVFASSCHRPDSSTPASLSKLKYLMIDPRGVLSPDTSVRSPFNEPAYPYPAYRLEEIAATYGSLNEIVVLQDSRHFASVRLGFASQDSHLQVLIETHLRMLIRLSVEQQYLARLTERQHFLARGRHLPAELDMRTLNIQMDMGVNAARQWPGGPWGDGMNRIHWWAQPTALTAPTPENTDTPMPSPPWKIPKVTVMSLKKAKERMGMKEDSEEKASVFDFPPLFSADY